MGSNMRMWILIVAALCQVMGPAWSAEPKGLVHGAEFRSEWNSTVSARVDQRSLVQVMDHFCGSRRMAWVIDRRLDPDQNISTDLPLLPLSELLPLLLNSVHANAVTVGQSVIVGPQTKLVDLRTLAEAQRLHLQQTKLDVHRKQKLAQTMDLHWDDLTDPRLLVEQIVQRAKIELAGTEQIPYDLWRGGDLMGVTAGEAITVIAWQYDLQLTWQADGRGALVPAILPARVTRSFSITASRREGVKSQFPQLTWTVEGKSLQASGRVEELEAVDQWIKGSTPLTPKPKPKKEPKDWRNRTFTLRIKNAPVRDVLAALKQQGIPLEWNEEALTTAGVDMKAKMQLELKNATSEELLSALCSAAKLKYEVTASNAKLSAP